MMKKIRTAIILDTRGALGMTPEEECTVIERELRGMGIEPDIVHFGHGVHQIDKRVDLLILDYGGVSYGVADLASWQVRAALEWGEDHPGALLILWSDFTRDIYEHEFQDVFGDLTNVIYRFRDDTIGERREADIMRWFGITEDDLDVNMHSGLLAPQASRRPNRQT